MSIVHCAKPDAIEFRAFFFPFKALERFHQKVRRNHLDRRRKRSTHIIFHFTRVQDAALAVGLEADLRPGIRTSRSRVCHGAHGARASKFLKSNAELDARNVSRRRVSSLLQ